MALKGWFKSESAVFRLSFNLFEARLQIRWIGKYAIKAYDWCVSTVRSIGRSELGIVGQTNQIRKFGRPFVRKDAERFLYSNKKPKIDEKGPNRALFSRGFWTSICKRRNLFLSSFICGLHRRINQINRLVESLRNPGPFKGNWCGRTSWTIPNYQSSALSGLLDARLSTRVESIRRLTLLQSLQTYQEECQTMRSNQISLWEHNWYYHHYRCSRECSAFKWLQPLKFKVSGTFTQRRRTQRWTQGGLVVNGIKDESGMSQEWTWDELGDELAVNQGWIKVCT